MKIFDKLIPPMLWFYISIGYLPYLIFAIGFKMRYGIDVALTALIPPTPINVLGINLVLLSVSLLSLFLNKRLIIRLMSILMVLIYSTRLLICYGYLHGAAD